MEKYFIVAALVIAILGAVKDVRGRRIPNWLTYSGICGALACRPLLLGWAGLEHGLLGILAGGGIFYVFFLLGGMGGGDVKLMAAVGAWTGIAQVLYVLIATAIAGGILAIGYMVFQKQIRRTLWNTVELLRHHTTSGFRPHPVLNVREPGSLRIPYGLAVAIGTGYCARTIFWRG